MSDQEIIDTIDVSLREHMTPGAPSDGSYCCARAVLAALRERYAIVPRPEPPIGGYERIVESGKKRYATVELPKPDEGWFDQWLGGDVHLDTTSEYVLQEPYNHGEIIWHTPSQARKLAAALLAATDKAKEGK